jgi:hypothetical protein
LCGAILALLLAGCASYQLGPTNGMAAGEKSIQVMPFVNSTMEPRLGDEVTQQMRKQLQRDATFKLASRGDADIVVTGEITRYQRFEMSFAPNDILTVRDFRLMITAQVTARDRISGKVLLDQPVSGNTLLRVGSDLTSAERQALPLLAADLAYNTTVLLVDGTW